MVLLAVLCPSEMRVLLTRRGVVRECGRALWQSIPSQIKINLKRRTGTGTGTGIALAPSL